MSKRYNLCVEVIDAFKAWDMDRIMAYRADNCIQEIAPSKLLFSSLSLPSHSIKLTVSTESLGQPARDNAAYRQYFEATMPLFTNFTPTAHEIIVDEAGNKASIWCSSTAETPVGPYANEYTLFLYFNETGDKVVRVVEFVDSDFSRAFFGKMAKLAAQKQGQANM